MNRDLLKLCSQGPEEVSIVISWSVCEHEGERVANMVKYVL